MLPVLEVENSSLLLKDLSQHYFNDHWKMVSNPKVMKYTTCKIYSSHFVLKDFINRKIIENRKFPKHGQRAIWAIIDSSEDVFIGTIDIKISNSVKSVRIGYSIREEYWGKGIATSVVNRVIDYLRTSFSEIGFVYADIHADNKASLRVLQKNGFKLIQENVTRKNKGEKIEVLLLKRSLTKSDRKGENDETSKSPVH